MARMRARRSRGFQEYPIGANTSIDDGNLVMLVGGYALPAAANAGQQGVAGVAHGSVDNTGGAAGALMVTVEEGIFTLPATGMAQADVGTTAYASDVDLVSGAQGANEPPVGPIRRFRSATLIDVEVGLEASRLTAS